MIKDNEYLITRYDKTVIDGRHWEHRAAQVAQTQKLLEYAAGFSLLLILIFLSHPPQPPA